jgi:hypothetical protein
MELWGEEGGRKFYKPNDQQFNKESSIVRSEENEYSIPVSNRTMKNITIKLSTPTKNLSKKKLWTKSLRNSWRIY